MGELRFSSNREESDFAMLPLALLIATAAATEDPDNWHCWPANTNAPYCGCQYILRTEDMINATCTAQFLDASVASKVHMFSVASSYPLPELSETTSGKFVWTGYEGLSHSNLHDIIYFFENDACWELGPGGEYMYNISFADDEYKWKPDVNCEPYGYAWPGPRLGNFNYDIARSVQTYNLPIYGLDQGQTVTVQINKMHNDNPAMDGGFLELKNVTAHHGHGTATADDCYNEGRFVYYQNPNHMGQLEYASFNLCDSKCWPDKPNDYCFNVPSSWNSFVQA